MIKHQIALVDDKVTRTEFRSLAFTGSVLVTGTCWLLISEEKYKSRQYIYTRLGQSNNRAYNDY